MIRRRAVLSLLGGAAAAWPLVARAQQLTAKKPRVGWLVTGSPETYLFSLAAFRNGLKALGYVEGQNIELELRWAEGNIERLPELAQDLVQQKVDVIIAGGSLGAQAAKRATSLIPIVAAGVGDLVELNLVSSLARPDGNLTGFVASAPETAGKRLQIINELKPNTRRVAILWNSASSAAKLEWQVTQEFAISSGIVAIAHDTHTIEELRSALLDIPQSTPEALVVLNDPFMFTHRRLITDAARQSRLPSVYGFREYADDGGLVSYGASITHTYRRAAAYVDKILRGAKLSDLPVQLPTKFELVVNLKTAKAIGLSLSDSFLMSADEVIE